MKRKAFLLWLLVWVVLAAPVGALAAPSVWDSLVPKGADKVGKVTVEYNRYPLSHYQLDLVLEERSIWEVDEKLSDTGHSMLHIFVNTLWQVNVEVSRIIIWVLEESLKLDLVGEFIQSIAQGIQTFAGFNTNLMDRGFYGLFFPLMIVLLGGWVGWKAMAEMDEDSAVRGIIYAMVVIFLSFGFFYYADDIGSEANRAATEISKGVMALTTNVFRPTDPLSSKEATAQAGNNLWHMQVMMPFKLLEFGDLNVDNKRVENVLKTPPDQRQEVLDRERNQYKNTMITPQNSGNRLGFILMHTVLNLFISTLPLFVALYKLFYQVYFLFLLLLAPIALTWAILPSWRESLYKWASEVLGALLMQVGLGVLLSVYLAIGGALYRFSINKGYLLTMLLQLVLIVLVIKQRKVIFQLVTVPATFLHWNKAWQSDRLPRWMPTEPYRAEPYRAVEGFVDKAMEGGKSEGRYGGFGHEGSAATESAATQEPPVELKEIPHEELDDLVFEPYDDPSLPDGEKKKLDHSSIPMLDVVDEKSENVSMLEGPKEKELELVEVSVQPSKEENDGPPLLVEDFKVKDDEK